MYLLVQANEYYKYAGLLDQSFRLRKKVFADRLGWKVSVSDHRERDQYDDLDPAYLLWCDDRHDQLYGSIRLMPTTGPTLLYDVFRQTFPDACDLSAPGIWEGTRMCIDDEAIARDCSDLRPDRAFALLLLALCEVALDSGIHTMISNYEPHMRRIYRQAGAELDELGRADGYGRRPVCCGAFEVSTRVLTAMRSSLNVSETLYRRPPLPSRALSSPIPVAA
ncbi:MULTISPECIES: acyl-homoserine-lactone synthase [unclassified Shinella]|uniref:acyl-homoserine-lactone synthase n=1 Tax=unclassified Shinella TaxID=2643062 RepID=UPI00225CC39B|nr:acyl-homoserine-lactone synthase [Shinella sp. YE25]MDC7259540.1 N-acyl-L-homoserine lactone (AHL) synthase [Shinella sp. YE25]CAI0341317.1 Acyl-homoserine-lactone synthase [Rhizobiaceae bacterium]CAK7260954.1 Acyl-homoserine-lactone synthase [Shinella sp. WSC3-e]